MWVTHFESHAIVKKSKNKTKMLYIKKKNSNWITEKLGFRICQVRQRFVKEKNIKTVYEIQKIKLGKKKKKKLPPLENKN